MGCYQHPSPTSRAEARHAVSAEPPKGAWHRGEQGEDDPSAFGRIGRPRRRGHTIVARFLYRLVSLFFLVAGIGCWLTGALLTVGQFFHGPHLDTFILTIWAFVLGPLLLQSSGEAWRAARDHYYTRYHY
jgi:hypothetical protein